MSPSQLTAIGSVLVFLSLCSLIWAAMFLVSDKRARRKAEARKHVTILDALSPEPLTARWCPSCTRRVVNPKHETFQACPVCGSELAHVSLVVAAEPTDDPPTLPDGGPRAA